MQSLAVHSCLASGSNMNDAEIEATLQASVVELQSRLTRTYALIATGYTATGNISPLFALGKASEYIASRNADLKPVDYFVDISGWLIDCCMGRKSWPEDSQTINRQGALNAFKNGLQAAHEQLDLAVGRVEIVPGLTRVKDLVLDTGAQVAIEITDAVKDAAGGLKQSVPWVTIAIAALVVLYVLIAARGARPA